MECVVYIPWSIIQTMSQTDFRPGKADSLFLINALGHTTLTFIIALDKMMMLVIHVLILLFVFPDLFPHCYCLDHNQHTDCANTFLSLSTNFALEL